MHVNIGRVCPRLKNESRLDSSDFGFIRAGVSTLRGYKRNVWVVYYKLTAVENQRKNCQLADNIRRSIA